jgi:ubiquitin carboxyl-terminal hydrolase 4/11/15
MINYWLNDEYKAEINRDNPLGWKGRVAEEYGSLVQDIWSGKYKTIVPSNFKRTIGEFAPQFAGYQQHDSSELLNFLMDGIHEDLNRVQEKPYTSVVEGGDGRPDAEVAAEAWDTHRLRHDSIIVDKFQGLLKSKVDCPECDRISVTFDPFMNLSVPLPTAKEKSVTYHFVYADERPITVYSATANKTGSVLSLKSVIESQTGVPAQRLVIAEVWKSKIYKVYANDYMLADIREMDDVWVWEVPEMDEVPEQKERERDLDYSFTQILNHKLVENPRWKPSSKWTPQYLISYYGIPVPIVVPASGIMKAGDIRRKIHEAMTPYVVGDDPTPYSICILKQHSSTMKNELPEDDDEDVNISRASFGLEWNEESSYDASRADNVVIDESARASDGAAVRKSDSIQLEDCIAAYTEEETLSEENAWYCSSCREHRCANKKFDIWSLPEVLIIHLKRFEYTRMYRDRINTLVEFPIEGLDLSQWVISDSGESNVYDLYGVSNHFGGLGGGHYTAYIKSIEDGEWYEMDDSSVRRTSAANSITSAAYVLFYQRRSS